MNEENGNQSKAQKPQSQMSGLILILLLLLLTPIGVLLVMAASGIYVTLDAYVHEHIPGVAINTAKVAFYLGPVLLTIILVIKSKLHKTKNSKGTISADSDSQH